MRSILDSYTKEDVRNMETNDVLALAEEVAREQRANQLRESLLGLMQDDEPTVKLVTD